MIFTNIYHMVSFCVSMKINFDDPKFACKLLNIYLMLASRGMHINEFTSIKSSITFPTALLFEL